MYRVYNIESLLKYLKISEEELYELTFSVGYTAANGVYNEYYLRNIEISSEYGDEYIDANCFDDNGAVVDDEGNNYYTYKIERFTYIKVVDESLVKNNNDEEVYSESEKIFVNCQLKDFFDKYGISKAEFKISEKNCYPDSDVKIIWLDIYPEFEGQGYLVLSKTAARVYMEGNLVNIMNLYVSQHEENGEQFYGIVVCPKN